MAGRAPGRCGPPRDADVSEPIRITTHRPALGETELAAVAEVFASGWLGLGEVTAAFEEALRARVGVRHVIGVSSGTAALHLALDALDLPPGSEVLTPSLTFVATPQAILAAGLEPVFCEIDPATLQIDLADAASRIGPRTRAIVPVHYGGAACPPDALGRLSARHGLRVVEDAAHAFGSSAGGRPLGTLGDAGCFSFDPIKSLTCGEGGAVVTNSDVLAERVRQRRTLGMRADGWSRHTGAKAWRYDVISRGYRYHLPNLNAAIGLAQLARFDTLRARRQAIVPRYHAGLGDVAGLSLVTEPSDSVCPFTYVVRVHGGRRDQLMDHLRARGIGTAVEYIPNHLHTLFADRGARLPVTERVFAEILSLPLHAALGDADVDEVIDGVRDFVAQVPAGAGPAAASGDAPP